MAYTRVYPPPNTPLVTGSTGSPGRWILGSLGRWVTKSDPVPCLAFTPAEAGTRLSDFGGMQR